MDRACKAVLIINWRQCQPRLILRSCKPRWVAGKPLSPTRYLVARGAYYLNSLKNIICPHRQARGSGPFSRRFQVSLPYCCRGEKGRCSNSTRVRVCSKGEGKRGTQSHMLLMLWLMLYYAFLWICASFSVLNLEDFSSCGACGRLIHIGADRLREQCDVTGV